MDSASSIRRYAYVARNARGGRVTGEISADSRPTAYQNLSERRGLTVFSLHETKSLVSSFEVLTARALYWFYGTTIAKAKLIFFRQMAKFMRHGMPIERALNTCMSTSQNPRFREVLRVVTADIIEGRHPRFSEALALHEEFSTLEVAMIRAGEGGAGFPMVLERIERLLSRNRRIVGKVTRALFYPAFVTLGIVGFLVYIVTYFVPQFAKIASEFDQATPPYLVILTNIGEWLASPFTVTVLVILAAIVFIGTRTLLLIPSVAYAWDAFFLRVIIAGEIRRKAIRSTFSRLYSSLMAAGVPIEQAFDLVIETITSPVYRRALREIREAIRLQGGSFSEYAAKTGWFDPDYVALISAGEQSASMTDSFDTVADEDDADVDDMLDSLSALLEPILIGVLGIAVAVIVGTVYGSIYSLIGKIK
jgi:type II secretory pathway component PulF